MGSLYGAAVSFSRTPGSSRSMKRSGRISGLEVEFRVEAVRVHGREEDAAHR